MEVDRKIGFDTPSLHASPSKMSQIRKLPESLIAKIAAIEHGKFTFAHLLSRQLKKTGTLEYDPRELRRCRTFYEVYPKIWGALSPKLDSLFPTNALSKIRGTLSPKSEMPPTDLVRCLSFSHFVELIELEDSLKRSFYEIECIRGNWSVRDLKRQIASLYYERSGLSKNKKKLASL